jgi:hypothetical protein
MTRLPHYVIQAEIIEIYSPGRPAGGLDKKLLNPDS